MDVLHNVCSLLALHIAWAFARFHLLIAIRTNDKDIPVIKSIKLGWKESSVTSTIVTSKPPLLSTNLASVYDPLLGRNLIIYQDKKTLRIVDATNTDGKGKPDTIMIRGVSQQLITFLQIKKFQTLATLAT